MGQKCKTSAIPPKLTFSQREMSTRSRTIIRVPMDNGWESRQPLLNHSFKAALQSPFTDRFTLHSHHRELSVDSHLPATTLFHRFLLYMILPLYARMNFLSTTFSKIVFKNINFLTIHPLPIHLPKLLSPLYFPVLLQRKFSQLYL